MQFFVVDNRATHVTRLQGLLKSAFPDSTIWPPGPQTLENWATVAAELQANTADDENLVVVLDLGVESEDMASTHSGVEQAFALKSLRPHAVFISYTQWPDLAEDQPHYHEAFDAGIDKQRLTSYETLEEQQKYVERTIRSAIRKKLGTKPAYHLKDSFGLRLAIAAFGERVFEFLIDEVAPNWSDIEVAALTSGHSGAFIFRISGNLEASPQKIVVKCARDAQLIKNETGRVNQFLAELGPLAEVLAPFEQHARELSEDTGYYYRQAEIEGEPMLETLQMLDWTSETETMLESIVSLEIRCYQRREGEQFGTIRASKTLGLTAIDRGRAAESLRFLEDVGAWSVQRSAWPNGPTPAQMCGTVGNLLDRWDEILERNDELFGVAQHGDLNPGNVLIPSPGRVVLIDFARVGRWPIGYDISRLATMLRVRLTESDKHQDWADNRLQHWALQQFCNVDTDATESDSLCPAADYCDREFRAFVVQQRAQEQEQLFRGYKLGSLWDLLKVLSYSDLSPFKRLWALVAVSGLASNLRLLR